MGVQLTDTSALEGGHDPRIEPGRERGVLGVTSGQLALRGQATRDGAAAQTLAYDGVDAEIGGPEQRRNRWRGNRQRALAATARRRVGHARILNGCSASRQQLLQ